MPWTMADRHSFVDLMSSLETEGSRSRAVDFTRERSSTLLDEVSALPGVDQVRAGLLRAMKLADDPRWSEAASAAKSAIEAYVREAPTASPTLLQRRHPAWVGLAALESGLELDVAIASARAGFEAYAGKQDDGDVLWAMAEAADDVGWATRHAELLNIAVNAPFTDTDHRDQVRLLLALELAERDADAALAPLTAIAADEEASERARVHASWVAAALYRRAADTVSAERLLRSALELIDRDAEPDIAERLELAIAELGPVAEA